MNEPLQEMPCARAGRALALAAAATIALLYPARSQSKPIEAPNKSVAKRFFDSLSNVELPFTSPLDSLSLRVNPKLKDMIDDPYIRLPVRLKYGLAENIETTIGYTPYLPNPFTSDSFGNRGYWEAGFKSRVKRFLDEHWQLAYGANARFPLEISPTTSRRYDHASYKPYFAVSYHLRSDPRYQWFVNISYDFIERDPFDHVQLDPTLNSLFIARPGIVFYMNEKIQLSMALDYKTDIFDGGDDHGIALVPGIVWFPDKEKWARRIPGDFDIGLTIGFAVDQLEENRDRSDIRVSMRVKYRLDRKKRKQKRIDSSR